MNPRQMFMAGYMSYGPKRDRHIAYALEGYPQGHALQSNFNNGWDTARDVYVKKNLDNVDHCPFCGSSLKIVANGAYKKCTNEFVKHCPFFEKI